MSGFVHQRLMIYTEDSPKSALSTRNEATPMAPHKPETSHTTTVPLMEEYDDANHERITGSSRCHESIPTMDETYLDSHLLVPN